MGDRDAETAIAGYYVKRGDREKGPYGQAELLHSLSDGALKRKSLVRAEGSDEWVELETVVSLPTRESPATAAMREAEAEAERLIAERKRRDVLIGGVICAIGVVITLGSYTAASDSGGGRYVLAWGAIIFGGLKMMRGLMR